jgi:Zn-dependent protease with chaperone function
MNYFASQDQARRRTLKLVALFAAAVLGVIAAIYAPLAALAASDRPGDPGFWNPPLLGSVAGLVILVVGLASLGKIAQLGKGGSTVAELLGGRRIDPATRDRAERQLLNVIEEMAIASGVAVPPVYLIEDLSINAFAAGYASNTAVIGVTRGCMQQLDREQLQGVMAHEFSHILNGDMRLNIRLAGVIFGILVIGMIGWGMARFVGPVMLRSGGGRRNEGAAVGAAIIALGLLLMLVGSIGTLFGRLIQAAVSRQREFLADASAVQFTRNPRGIAGALRRIGGLPPAAAWNSHVSEFGHLFFSSAFASLFATHPPLRERIARIEGIAAQEVAPPPAPAAAARPAAPAAARGFAAPCSRAGIEQAVAAIGAPDPERCRRTAEMLASLPPGLIDAAHEPADARAILIGLLLAADEPTRRVQAAAISDDAALLDSLRRLAPLCRQVPDAALLPIVDLCVPAIAELSPPQYREFRERLTKVILADRKVDLREWVVRTVLLRHVEARFRRDEPPRSGSHRLEQRRDAAALVLSVLARAGHDGEGRAAEAFAAGVATLGWAGAGLEPLDRCTLDSLEAASRALASTRMTERGRLLKAAVVVIAHDGEARPIEVQLLRAVGDLLDCPIPPVL